MTFKGIVFDLDGILTDTEDIQYLGWVEALKPHGVELSKERYFGYAGRKRLEIAADLVEKHKLDLAPDALAEAKNTWLFARFERGNLPLMAGAVEAIEYLLSRGVRVAVVSNCVEKELLLKLKGSKLGRYFKTRVSLDDVEKGKPHPDLYLYACKKLGFEPHECLAFEDTQAGVESAKAAGLTCFAVPNEYTRGQDFSAADKVFASLPEAVGTLR